MPDASTSGRLRRLARETFGWRDLRPEQLTAMRHVLDGDDVLVVMPTGSGKSAIYQLPTMLLPGPAIVVSPLIALQRDQIGSLGEAGAPEAVAVNSAQGARDTEEAFEAATAGDAEYLFLSPEQLAKDDVLDRLAGSDPALLVVDEAHCVSAWGHDFRPDYLRLRHAAEYVGRPPVLALTATAGGPVRDDIVEKLGLRDPARVVAGFDRPNLHLAARETADDDSRAGTVAEHVARAAKPGLVYTATRRDTERLARLLRARDVRAEAFHAGLRAPERGRVQDAFMAGEVDVVVATSAFGMGIDKPDVRFVVHAAPPDSLDSYYQQIGRAGRDGEPAHALLVHRGGDFGLQRFLTSRSLDEDAVRELGRAIRRHEGRLRPADAEAATGRSHRAVTRDLNLLEQAGVVRRTRRGELTWAGGDTDPVRAAAEELERRQRLDRSRVEVLREYAETRTCRRRFLLGYFGQDLPGPCGFCDRCDEGSAAEHAPAEHTRAEFPLRSRVRHREWGEGNVVTQAADRITVLFDDAGYRTLSLAAVREQGLLTHG
ncbi:RecQ family ATP-dependent DNA helicase [Prauserella flavalba]|uniref:ATP-dependent DNA helicase RecQ n=1 Tax=Prauserella flavalba TaxID=1477506 RepID=A0A318LQZ1_9PSEU|nr:RecQ family ATP-dependent DNA helicase [Prauserella flavalba]PXY30784.1 recombinase RecQ [Prauserella flavalba]